MQSFFDAIALPGGWVFVGRKDVPGSIGAVVKVSPFVTLRIFQLSGSGKGGIVEKRYNEKTRSFDYKCVIQNKTVDEINEFITKHYNQ